MSSNRETPACPKEPGEIDPEESSSEGDPKARKIEKESDDGEGSSNSQTGEERKRRKRRSNRRSSTSGMEEDGDEEAALEEEDEEKEKRTRPQCANRKLFVAGLPDSVGEDSMTKYFAQFGRILDAVVMKNRGFGFVTFSDSEMVDACQAKRPHFLAGARVDVRRAIPKVREREREGLTEKG